MLKHNGLTIDELASLGYTAQPDGRMRLFKSWKSQCADCRLWFHRLKGEYCRGCYDKRTIAHRRQMVDEEKNAGVQIVAPPNP